MLRPRHTTAIVAVTLAAAVASGCGGSAAGSSGIVVRPAAAARHFLASYATSDGRVLRRDQGSDIVSEGQAYGMLLAEIGGREPVARTIWHWTRRHLQRSDHLLSWHATGDGQVLDPQSATDADILTAFALLRYRGPGRAGMHADGRRLASAVLAHESVRLTDGTLVPVAGPWATQSEPTVDPSYWSPQIFRWLAHATGDRRWSQAAAKTRALVRQVTHDGRQLPPDWARIAGDRLVPTPPPGQSGEPTYGLDAQRLPVWLATGCSKREHRLAGHWWRDVLSHHRSDLAAQTVGTNGTTVNGNPTPLGYVASSAAATAAGDAAAGRHLLAQAVARASAEPTYYGDAWVALGGWLLGNGLHC